MRTHATGCCLVANAASFLISGFAAPTTVWQPMHVLIAGMPGSGDWFAEKWQYRQFIPSCLTCRGCGKSIGCFGWRPCGDDAALYADRRSANTTSEASPGTAVNIRRRRVIALRRKGPTRPCELFHKQTQGEYCCDSKETARCRLHCS